MLMIVPCSSGTIVVNFFFRQLAGVSILDVCVDHVLEDFFQAFVLGKFYFAASSCLEVFGHPFSTKDRIRTSNRSV